MLAGQQVNTGWKHEGCERGSVKLWPQVYLASAGLSETYNHKSDRQYYEL